MVVVRRSNDRVLVKIKKLDLSVDVTRGSKLSRWRYLHAVDVLAVLFLGSHQDLLGLDAAELQSQLSSDKLVVVAGVEEELPGVEFVLALLA